MIGRCRDQAAGGPADRQVGVVRATIGLGRGAAVIRGGAVLEVVGRRKTVRVDGPVQRRTEHRHVGGAGRRARPGGEHPVGAVLGPAGAVVGHQPEVIGRPRRQTGQLGGDGLVAGTGARAGARGAGPVGGVGPVLEVIARGRAVGVQRAVERRARRLDHRRVRRRPIQRRRRRIGRHRLVIAGDRPGGIRADDPVVIGRVGQQPRHRAGRRNGTRTSQGIGLRGLGAVVDVGSVLEVIGRSHTTRVDRPVQGRRDRINRRCGRRRDGRALEGREALHDRVGVIGRVHRARGAVDRDPGQVADVRRPEALPTRDTTGTELRHHHTRIAGLPDEHLTRHRIGSHAQRGAAAQVIHDPVKHPSDRVTVRPACTRIRHVHPTTVSSQPRRADQRSIRRVQAGKRRDKRTRAAIKRSDDLTAGGRVGRRHVHRAGRRINSNAGTRVDRDPRRPRVQRVSQRSGQAVLDHRTSTGRDIHRTCTSRINRQLRPRIRRRRIDRKRRQIRPRSIETLDPRIRRRPITQRMTRITNKNITRRLIHDNPRRTTSTELTRAATGRTKLIGKPMPRRRQRARRTNQTQRQHGENGSGDTHHQIESLS